MPTWQRRMCVFGGIDLISIRRAVSQIHSKPNGGKEGDLDLIDTQGENPPNKARQARVDEFVLTRGGGSKNRWRIEEQRVDRGLRGRLGCVPPLSQTGSELSSSIYSGTQRPGKDAPGYR
jgi:hypothetical protein